MSASTAIFGRLSTTGAVTALVPAARITPQRALSAMSELPRIVFASDDEDPVRSYGGSSNLTSVRVVVACQHNSFTAMQAVAKQVRLALDGRGTWAGVTVLGCFYKGSNEYEEPLSEAQADLIVHTSELEFLVWYRPN